MRGADLTGQRFGRLTVVGYERRKEDRTHLWRCLCDCGASRIVAGRDLRSGHSQSCGCLRLERARAVLIKHEESKNARRASRLYRIWTGMKKRCNNTHCAEFKDYGGRGISVCQEWQEDYIAFREWALANGYTDNLTIDRIDVNGNYCPENCRWVTNAEQQRNKRKKKEVVL